MKGQIILMLNLLIFGCHWKNEQGSASKLISDLSVEGENIQWYNAAEGIALLDPEYVLTDGETVYASQTVDCESQELFAVLVSINESETPMVTEITFRFLIQNQQYHKLQ